MSKAITKTLTIEIEYTDASELHGLFNSIKGQINCGKNYNRQMYGTTFYEYRKRIISMPDFKEMEINGKWCAVYQSKMNKK